MTENSESQTDNTESTDTPKAGSGTIISAAVLSALPLDVPPRLLDIAFVAWFA